MVSATIVQRVIRREGVMTQPTWSRVVLAALMLAFVAPQVAFSQEDASDDIVLPPTPAAMDSTAKYSELAEAQQIILEGDLNRAVEKLEEACAKYDELSPPKLILAQILFSSRRPREINLARTVLEDVVVDYPDDPEGYMTLAEIAIREGRLAEGELSLDRAEELLEKLGGNAERKQNLKIRLLNYNAHLAETRGNYEEARSELEAWLAIDDAEQAHYRLGMVLFRLGEEEAAYESLRKGENATENLPNALVMMGRLYQSKNDFEQAQQWMKRALDEKPEDVPTLLMVAQWMLQNRQYDDAQPLAEKAVSLDPDSIDAKVISGVIARFRGDQSKAERFLESAHLQSPVNFAASNNLALALLEQGSQAKIRRALELAEMNARQFNNTEAVMTLGWAYYHLGRLEEANRLFQALVNARPVSADLLYYMAKVSAKRGKNAEALEQLNRALESDVPFANETAARELAKELGEETTQQ